MVKKIITLTGLHGDPHKILQLFLLGFAVVRISARFYEQIMDSGSFIFTSFNNAISTAYIARS
jgi:hypothetical protein